MKIYFAYRTGYEANNRFIREFEADSVLDFFQKYWDKLTLEEECDELLGTRVYGFPISDYNDDDNIAPPVPKTIDELITGLTSYVYSHEVLGDKDYIEVHTDDDEIELAWYVFSEDYKNASMDKLALWFYPTLPTQIQDTNALFEPDDVTCIELSDDDNTCYFMSSAIYDSGNFEDMQFIKLKGTNIGELINHLQAFNFNELRDDEFLPYGIDELHTLKCLANKFNLNNLASVINVFNKYPRLIESGVSDKTDWQNIQENDEYERSVININEHIVEFGIYDYSCFHYYVLFDKKWANTYPELAQSIQQFGTTWQIGQTDD